MLYMIVNTHSAESCAFRGEQERDLFLSATGRFESLAADKGFELKGTWAYRPGHEIFMLVDADDAHVLEQMLIEAGLVGRTHSRILPVVPLDEAI